LAAEGIRIMAGVLVVAGVSGMCVVCLMSGVLVVLTVLRMLAMSVGDGLSRMLAVFCVPLLMVLVVGAVVVV
jgi:hypothetical protein